jgi:purine-binding chemotaxis protein CheW
MEGIINLRGTVIPVICLRKRFGLPAVERDVHTRVAVMDLEDGCVGFIVDMVSEVIRVKRSDIQPAAVTLEDDWIEGILNLEKLIVVMHPDKLGEI